MKMQLKSLSILVLATFMLTGCPRKKDSAIDKAKDKIEDVGDKIEDATDK